MDKTMAQNIVDGIRINVLDGLSGLKPGHYDPWDEGQNGVNWLDNEIGMLNDLYEIIEPKYQHQYQYEKCSSVEDVKNFLEKESTQYLTYLYKFVELGGTGAPYVFEIRSRKDWKETLQFLNSKQGYMLV